MFFLPAQIDQALNIRGQQCNQIGLAITEHDGLGDIFIEFQFVFDRLRSDILATGGDDQFFFPIDDIDKALLIYSGDVTGLEPAIFKGLLVASSFL